MMNVFLRAAIATAACFVTLLSTPASAKILLPGRLECSSFQQSERALPGEIAAFFEDASKRTPESGRPWFEGAAIKRCAFRAETFYTYQTPVITVLGVCYFTEIDISDQFTPDRHFRGEALARTKIPDQPPQKMLVSNGPCPVQGDPSYTATDLISPGVFRSIMEFWTRMARSEPDLNAAMAACSFEGGQDHCATVRGMFRNGAPHMERLTVHREREVYATDFEIHVGAYRVDVDLGDQGWKILRVGMVIY